MNYRAFFKKSHLAEFVMPAPNGLLSAHKFYSALSGLDFGFIFIFPGRCPSLLHFSLSGKKLF